MKICHSWIACLMIIEGSCSDGPAARPPSSIADPAEQARILFDRALRDYSQALDEGYRLDERGMGRGPITHVSLFSDYQKFFYLPLSAEALLKPEWADFLKTTVGVGKPLERELADRCLEIAGSKRKLRRDRGHHIADPIDIGFVLYHYDP